MHKSFFTKVIVIILACLLIFVGVSDLMSDNNKKEEIARIGKEVITLDEYKSLYQNYGKQILESDISEEQTKRIKYDLLNALIEQKLLFNLISDLKLVVGEESIKDYISNTKYFQNNKGEFDKRKFYETLNALDMTEKEYTEKLRKILPAMMFITSLFKDSYPMTFGEKIDEQIYKNRYQTRVVDIVKITKNAITTIPKPNDQVLLDLYEKNELHFYSPEYRIAQCVFLNRKHFEDQITISDEEVNDMIEHQKLKDQRDVYNLVFNSKNEAESAREAFKNANMSLDQIAEKFCKTKLEETRINNITKNFLQDDIGEKVFTLKAGEVSEVLESSFGWHIIKVESIHEISREDLADLKKNVKSALVNRKSFERINDFINQANYRIYNGATINEISNEYNLPVQTIGPIDANGIDQNGNNLKISDDLVAFIFSRKKEQKSYFKGIENAVISAKIIDIIPPKLQNFEKSKTSVEDLWRDKFIKEQMFKIAKKIAIQLKENKDLKKSQGIELIKNQQIHRNETNQQNYPSSFIEEIFNMKMIGLVTDPIQYNNEFMVGILKEMYLSNGKLNTFDTGKRAMLSLKAQLINYLELRYKVEINHAILNNI
ncbi:MAG: SurA N-terminal domain-containing protein [Wolbachia endosymbiont of Meromenopon meropis]|nr:SurA N-terminal domain-containing protein [Wolbachia endosymbiont of Meromenopon meropis]